MKSCKIEGPTVSRYWELKGRLYLGYAHAARGDAEHWALYADGRALDEAYEICRVAFERYDDALDTYGRNFKSYIVCEAFQTKHDCYLVFLGMLKANLGIDKDC